MTWLVDHPVVVAPMAGGPTTPALVAAAGRAGGVGFLAAGYKTVDAVAAEVEEVGSTGLAYGVNVFVPGAIPDAAVIRRYRQELQVEYDRFGVEPPELVLDDDDAFGAKIDLLADLVPPVVSFAFGVPPVKVVRRLRSRGIEVLVTVTCSDEARAAVEVGADALVAQGGQAGGHAATMHPERYTGTRTTREVLAEVSRVADLPVVAAGGVGTADDVRSLLEGGAVAVQCGTRFLAAAEAGTRPVHVDALLTHRDRATVVTRAFTGHPARALINRFTETYSGSAPVAYPAVHHLTAPIRAAAAREGDAESLHLWAGTGFAHVERGSAAHILRRLDPRA
jgi:nitronate monooxygenase